MNTTDTDVTKQDTHAWLFGWKNATIFQARGYLEPVCLLQKHIPPHTTRRLA
jgi:hypothetical protein